MNTFMKKALSITVILCIFSQWLVHTFANIDTVKVQLDSVEMELQSSINKADIIIQKVDVYMNKTTLEQRNVLDRKLSILKNKIESKSGMTEKEKNILLLIDYLQLKISYKNIMEAPDKNNLLAEYNMSLSDSENQKFNSEMVQLQKNLLNSWIHSLENILWDFEELTNIEEAWDFSMKLDVDHEMVWKIKTIFELEGYTATTSGFDSQLKWNMRALIDSAPQWQEAIKFEMKAFIDFISKDQNIYLLMNKFSILSEEWVDEMKAFIEKVKQVAQTNKYIHMPNDQWADFIALMRWLSPQSLSSEGNKIMSEPMFRAYKKQGNKYSIVPTLYACSTIKELAQKFDPFFGEDCTEWQYQDFLWDLAEAWFEMYLDIWTIDNTLWFSVASIDNIDSMNGSITFNDTSLEWMTLVVVPNQQQAPGEGLDIQYSKNWSLNINMTADWWDTQMVLESLLDGNNLFSSIDMSMKSDGMSGSMNLKDNIISWSYSIGSEYEKMVWNISWSTQKDNSIKTFNITNQFVWNDTDNTTKLEYNMWSLIITNAYLSNSLKSDLMFTSKWNNETIIGWELDITIQQKEMSFNEETYDREWVGDFKDVFVHNVSLVNNRISWETNVYQWDNEMLSIKHWWTYKKDMLEFNNSFSITGLWMMIWSQEAINWNLNIRVDTMWNNNNGNIFLNVLIDSKEALELEIDNTGTRVYRKITIEKPNDNQIIPLEEVFENPAY